MTTTTPKLFLPGERLTPEEAAFNPFVALYQRYLPPAVTDFVPGQLLWVGSAWNTDLRSEHIVVFEEYLTLRDRIFHLWTQRPFSPVLLTGNPGIGKTQFLTFLLAVAASQRLPVICCDMQYIFALTPDSGFSRIKDVLWNDQRLTAYTGLIDGTPDQGSALNSLLLQSRMRFVFAASPNISHTGWLKRREAVTTVFVMNPPSVDETLNSIFLDREVLPRSEASESLALRYLQNLGPNIRSLQSAMKSVVRYEALYEAMVIDFNELELSTVQKLFTQKSSLNLSHPLFKSRRRDDPQLGTKAYIESDTIVHELMGDFVWEMLLRKINSGTRAQQTDFYRLFNSVPATRSAAGKMYVNYVHDWICDVGTLCLYSMAVSADGERLEYDTRTSARFSMEIGYKSYQFFDYTDSDSETTNLLDYHISKNPTYDSCLLIPHGRDICGLAFKATFSATHSVEDVGMEALRKRFGRCTLKYFVFVTPSSHFHIPLPQSDDFYYLVLPLDIPWPSHD